MMAGFTPPRCNIKNVTHCKDGDNFWNSKGKTGKMSYLCRKKEGKMKFRDFDTHQLSWFVRLLVGITLVQSIVILYLLSSVILQAR